VAAAAADYGSSALGVVRMWCRAVAAGMLAALLAPQPASATTAQESSPTVWLCRPGLAENPCESDVIATVVQPDGRVGRPCKACQVPAARLPLCVSHGESAAQRQC
jgi:hypothetical protein